MAQVHHKIELGPKQLPRLSLAIDLLGCLLQRGHGARNVPHLFQGEGSIEEDMPFGRRCAACRESPIKQIQSLGKPALVTPERRLQIEEPGEVESLSTRRKESRAECPCANEGRFGPLEIASHSQGISFER
ncbi:MAG TPA: hypothetical protein VEL74_07360 [Thermoanaerobaculia bacterium]|nr:hypothetical protein [Thermoanaerobaculia bacterium]